MASVVAKRAKVIQVYPIQGDSGNPVIAEPHIARVGAITSLDAVPATPYIVVPTRVDPVSPKQERVARVVEEPDRVQVANYNVQPLLTIEFYKAWGSEGTLNAELVEEKSRETIYKGFKAGGTAAVAKDSRQVSVYGLKLNRLGHLRNQLEIMKTSSKDPSYYIRLVFNKGYDDERELCRTSTFTLVSSFTQLPEDLKELRNKRTGKATNTSN